MPAKIGSAIQLLLAMSIFYLGYSIHSMTTKITEVVDTYPKILEDVQGLSETLQVEQWLEMADALESLLPSVIQSVDGITSAVSDANTTVASIDQKIPAIVEEVSQYRQYVIPPVVSEATRYRTDVLPKLLIESKGYRETTVPQLVKESQSLRREIPPILAEADKLAIKTEQILDQSQDIAKEATQGAVKGVILSPIDLLRDAGNGIKERVVTEE
ncbi:MAG: hypothetical protein AAGJ78_00680 [Pseudomonadota bacterium]